jgi:hypothetical protein
MADAVSRRLFLARSGRTGYAPLVEPLSPELALVDPVLAEWARAQLTDSREPVPRAGPVRQRQQPLPAPPVRPGPASKGRLRPAPRGRIIGKAIVAVVAVALGGAAAAILASSYDGSSSSAGTARLAMQPWRDRSPQTATGEGGDTKTRGSTQGVAGARYTRTAARSRRRATGGSRQLGAVRTEPPGSPRPAAFRVPGAPKEPLDEIPLPVRARRLDAWLTPGRGPTGPNQRHWLYQHAWIVTGARFGWWHGAEALWLLIRVDRRVESRWGIGYRSEAAARRALAAVAARTK